MTLGFTGVVWLPRLAEGNSAMLHSGAHAVPLFAATASWGVLYRGLDRRRSNCRPGRRRTRRRVAEP